jgi:hypothetical protein
MADRPPTPLPDDIAGYLLDELPTILSTDDLFALERLVELAYQSGYAGGHLRGYQTGRRDERRAQAAKAQQGKPEPTAGTFPERAAS